MKQRSVTIADLKNSYAEKHIKFDNTDENYGAFI